LFNSNISSTCPHNMVNFGPLAAEIDWGFLGTPTNFNGFRVLAPLLHVTPVVGVSQTCGLQQRTPPIFGWAAITLGMGPHSSHLCFSQPMLCGWRRYKMHKASVMVIDTKLWFDICGHLLWPPSVADTDFILLPCGFFFLLFFFPVLISAIGDWMSTILPHMV